VRMSTMGIPSIVPDPTCTRSRMTGPEGGDAVRGRQLAI
jgi:hypothetical protein